MCFFLFNIFANITVDAAGNAKSLSVLSTNIKNNQNKVSLNFLITVKFNTVIMKGNTFGKITLMFDNKSIIISSTINKEVLTAKSKALLSYSTAYVFIVPAGAVKDSSGNINRSSIIIRFKTLDKVIPKPNPTSVPNPTPNPTPISEPPTPPQPAKLELPSMIANSHFGTFYKGRGEVQEGMWVRLHPGPFSWGSVESTKGVYNWDSVDKWVSELEDQNAGIIATIWPYASWDQEFYSDKPNVQNEFPQFLPEHRYPPHDTDAYTKWLKALVDRYDGNGSNDMPGLKYPVRHWEIINEPEMNGNGMSFFQGTSNEYLDVLKMSYQAIKSQDSNSFVLTGGQAGIREQSNNYWTPVIQGAKDYFDIGNVHDIGSQNGDFYAGEYKNFLNSLGCGDKPFWITEALVGSKKSPGYKNESEDDFAKLTIEYYATAFANGADVVVNVGSNDPSGGPGKASDKTYNLMASILMDFSNASKFGSSDVCFDMPDKSKIYVLWNNSTLPVTVSGTVKTIDYNGVEADMDAGKVIANVPMMVEVKAGQ